MIRALAFGALPAVIPPTRPMAIRILSPGHTVLASGEIQVSEEGNTIYVTDREVVLTFSKHGQVDRIEYDIPQRFGGSVGYQSLDVGRAEPGSTITLYFMERHRLLGTGE